MKGNGRDVNGNKIAQEGDPKFRTQCEMLTAS